MMALALAASCVCLGLVVSSGNPAHGEVRGTPEPPTFQSGAVPILRDISATLRQIDSRLGRLEVTVQRIQTSAAGSAQRADNGQRATNSN
jgi:hypothetical protein